MCVCAYSIEAAKVCKLGSDRLLLDKTYFRPIVPCACISPYTRSTPRPHSTHLPRCCNRLICMQQNFRVNFATQRAMLKCTMRRKQPNNICICSKYSLPLPHHHPLPYSDPPVSEPNCNAAVANGRIWAH